MNGWREHWCIRIAFVSTCSPSGEEIDVCINLKREYRANWQFLSHDRESEGVEEGMSRVGRSCSFQLT